MDKKIAIKKECVIISPLDFRHFVLDIPRVNEKYQKQTVAFALKSCYPGTEDNTSIDYAYKNSGVIGIAVSNTKLKNLQIETKKLISPTLVISNMFHEGIFITCATDWIEIQILNNDNLIEIHTFASQHIDSVLDLLKATRELYVSLKITIVNFDSDISTFETECCNYGWEYNSVNFNELLNNRIERKSLVFKEKKTSNKRVFYYSLITTLILISVFMSVYIISKKNSYKKTVEELKIEYNSLKKTSNIITKAPSLEKISYKQVNSLHEIISEIANTSDTIIITSFSYTKGNLRFEAENANAIAVLEKLRESSSMSDVTLIQSFIQENGKEKFIITGKVK